MHPAMRHVSAVRAKLGVRTIFNILGPLSNPAGASHQLLGAGRPELRPLLAAAIAQLGVERALVVSGEDGLGEMTLTGATHATEVANGRQAERAFKPEDFNLERAPLNSLRVTGPAQSADLVRRVLHGDPGPARDIVILNAAAGLITFDALRTPEQGAMDSAEAIDSGAAKDLLRRLVELSHA
jgi:anthranilate phosphoribosyltransferase